MTRTLEEWVAIYEKRLGVKYTPEPDEWISYDPGKGVFSFREPAHTEPGVLEVGLCVGDGKYWIRLMKRFMRDNGLETVRFITRRNPETWTRRYGARIRSYIMEADIDEIKD
jgi:hypothetical protein